MNKLSSLPVWLSGLAGILGAVVHGLHVRTCYDELGYIIIGQPLTALLIGLAFFLVLLSLVSGLWFSRHHSSEGSFRNIYSPKHGGLNLLCGLFASLLILSFAILYFLRLTAPTRIDLIVSALALLSAIGLTVFTCQVFTGKIGKSTAYLASLAALFFCLWMLLHFIGNNRNPVILSFCLECIAFGSTAMFLLGIGASAFGTPQHFTAVFFGLLSIGFSLTALTGQQVDITDQMLLIASVLLTAPPLLCCLRNPSNRK